MNAKQSKPIDEILKRYGFRHEALIGILQEIQKEERYLPREVLEYISQSMEIPLSRIYTIATFYKLFSLEPKGEHIVQVCQGTACHLRGGPRILETFERLLRIRSGQTTGDMEFSLETVNCLGACALAPLVKVDQNNHGKMAPGKAKGIISKYNKKQ